MSISARIGSDDDKTKVPQPFFWGEVTVSSTSTEHLSDWARNLVLLGTADIDGYGNARDNTLTGNPGLNQLFGRAGNDSLSGGDGNDVLFGDEGKDRLFGENGNDRLDGGRHDDRLDGGAGDDHISGSSGNDVLFGNEGSDSLLGGDGNDLLDGGAGRNLLQGGRGSDTYIVDSLDNTISDVSTAASDIDSVLASLSFTLTGNLDNLTLVGEGRLAGTGNDLANVVTGNGFRNTLSGLSGNDTLRGQGGDDTLLGGAGKDTLVGGAGADTLIGGTGRDSFVFTSVGDSRGGASGFDVIGGKGAGEGFERGDLIDLSAIDANTKVAGNQAFSLVKAFGGHAGELQVTKVAGAANSLLVSADVNGDAKADFVVQVNGLAHLQGGDFLL